MLLGTIVNALSIVAGTAVGLLIRYLGSRFPYLKSKADLGARLQERIMQAMGLSILLVAFSGILEGINPLICIFSLVIGTVIGETLNLQRSIELLGDWMERKLSPLMNTGGLSIGEGFVTATLLFCIGAMAIVGSLQSGLTGDHSTLFAKSSMDGVISIVMAASLGVGVGFSAIPILLFQGSIALLASYISPFLGDVVVSEMTCVGSLLILALAFNTLGLSKFKVMNMLPACFLPIFLCMVM